MCSASTPPSAPCSIVCAAPPSPRGDLDAAAEALALSVEAARARQADYEVALGLHTQARLAEARGAEVPAALLDERNEIFERAGVVTIPDLFSTQPALTDIDRCRTAGV